MYRARVMRFNKNNMPNDDTQKNAKHRRELLRKAIKRNENKKRDSDKSSNYDHQFGRTKVGNTEESFGGR